jgi:radical SAM protein with 4Fe4S-binding SPASM domain
VVIYFGIGERKKCDEKESVFVKNYLKKFVSRGAFPLSLPVMSREENIAFYRSSRMANSGDCPNRPLRLLVEVTSKCNLSCKMCNIHHDDRSGIMIDDVLLESTFEMAKTANSVSPFGLGEPLLHPRITEIVGKYKSLGASVELTTNGMLLNEKTSRGLIINGLDHLAFSIDAAESGLFSKIRRGADLNRISDNIGKLNHIKESLNSKNPALSLNVVVQAGNFSQLRSIIQLAEKWGIFFVTFVPITAHKHIPEIQGETLIPGLEHWEETMEICKAEAELRGVGIDTQRLHYALSGTPPEGLYSETIPCPEPFRFMVIRANGDIFPCCNWDVKDPMATVPSSATAKELIEVWQSRKWQALRERITSNKYPEQCKDCMANLARPFCE